MSRHWKTYLFILMIPAALAAAGRQYYRWTYPFGWSHCCDKGLMFALEQYADDHGGAYPSGEATPEASLSLLYPKYANANLLRGKTVPLEVVQEILEGGGRLGPDTCGWHYVEGIRVGDEGLALVWDKAGLGHNGERLKMGGHSVIFVRGRIDRIPGSGWDAFLAEQEQLSAARRK